MSHQKFPKKHPPHRISLLDNLIYVQWDGFQKNEIVLKIVLGNKDENIDDIINELRKTTGETKLDIKFVDSIPLVRTGKNMGAISHLNNDEILNNF